MLKPAPNWTWPVFFSTREIEVLVFRAERGGDWHEVDAVALFEVVEVAESGHRLLDLDGIVVVAGFEGHFAEDDFRAGGGISGDVDAAEFELLTFFDAVGDIDEVAAAGDAGGDFDVGVAAGSVVVLDGFDIRPHVCEGEGGAGFELEDWDEGSGVENLVAGDADTAGGVLDSFGDAEDEVDLGIGGLDLVDVIDAGVEVAGVAVGVLNALDIALDFVLGDFAFQVPEFDPVAVVAFGDGLEAARGDDGISFEADVVEDAAGAFVDAEDDAGEARLGTLFHRVADGGVGVSAFLIEFLNFGAHLVQFGFFDDRAGFEIGFVAEAVGFEDGIAFEDEVAHGGAGFAGNDDGDAVWAVDAVDGDVEEVA